MATSVVPWRQARPKESVTITAGATPKRAASASRIDAAEPSGILGRSTSQPPRRVRAVDAGAGADEAVLGLGDDEVAAAAAHRPGLAQDHRHVVVGLLDAALGLRDDLLRDDDHVALLHPSGPLDGVPEQGREDRPRASPPGRLPADDVMLKGLPAHEHGVASRRRAITREARVTLTPAFVL